MARYAILYGRPGPNYFTGVVIDYAYRVNRRSIFGYGLVRVLAPEGKNIPYRRYVAALLALPHWYRDAIAEHNLRHPTNVFVPQQGPTFTLSRLQMHPSQVPNMNLHTIIDLFLRNRIPPEWVDHGYTFGLNFINHQYSTSQLVIFYDELDNERLERLRVYGVPPAIPAWDGWRCPTDEDMRRIHQLVAYRAVQEAPDYDHRTERGWSRVGDDGIYQYLTDRTESSALSYRNLHPVSLPSFPLPPRPDPCQGQTLTCRPLTPSALARPRKRTHPWRWRQRLTLKPPFVWCCAGFSSHRNRLGCRERLDVPLRFRDTSRGLVQH